jgi:hypothetical protein
MPPNDAMLSKYGNNNRNGNAEPSDAGCRRPTGPADAVLDLADGNRVHLADGNRVHLADGYDCLIRQGTRWRAAARTAVSQTAEAAPSSPVTIMP